MRIKFITLTCEKYHNTRVSKIRETWGKNQDISFLSDFNYGDDIIGYDHLPRGYENIYYKYSEFFKNISDFSYDWYFFTDDDTFVNIPNILNLLCNYDKSELICLGRNGILNQGGTDSQGNQTGFPLQTIKGSDTELPIVYPGGGAGFILSVNSIIAVNKYLNSIDTNEIPRCYSSDVTVGFWIRNSNIRTVDVDGFWWTSPSELNHDEEVIKNSYTYHYISEEKMEELFNS